MPSVTTEGYKPQNLEKLGQRFITVEGIEGVGKSTLVARLKDYFDARQLSVLVTREPGGTEVGEVIRDLVLKRHRETLAYDTELLLMFAARAQHLQQLILPALQVGQWVICDRFTDASYAYQGGGRNIPFEKIALLEQCVHPNFQPVATLLLDAPVELALTRAQQRNQQIHQVKDRFESETHAFFQRVRNAYLQRATQFPQRFHILDASQPLSVLQQGAAQCVEKVIDSF